MKQPYWITSKQTMVRSSIPPPNCMDLKGNSTSNWETFKDSWATMYYATELNKKPDKVIAMLLTVIGQKCYKIYKNLSLTEDKRKSPPTIVNKQSEEFESTRNVICERYLYNSIVQESSESFDSFLNRLREHIATCKYTVLENEMLHDCIVIGINNDT